VQLSGTNNLSLAEVQVYGTAGMFHVAAPITRGQAAAAIANRFAWKLSDQTPRGNPTYPPPPFLFTDFPQTDPGFAPAEWMLQTGLTGGCGGTGFCPTQLLTRAAAAIFLVKGLALPVGQGGGIGLQITTQNNIADVPSRDPNMPGYQTVDYINTAVANGILSVDSNRNFYPSNAVTQGDFARALAQTIIVAVPYTTGLQLHN
jgi:hypothetical protein